VAQASAFKVVYAGLTKGLQGLFVELLMGARGFGLLDEILKRYEESFPGLLDKVTSSIVGLRVNAARRAEWMDELKWTFNQHGMKNFMASGRSPSIHCRVGCRQGLRLRCARGRSFGHA
jgi:hypothetical protein